MVESDAEKLAESAESFARQHVSGYPMVSLKALGDYYTAYAQAQDAFRADAARRPSINFASLTSALARAAVAVSTEHKTRKGEGDTTKLITELDGHCAAFYQRERPLAVAQA